MRSYSARHIVRMVEVNGVTTVGMELMDEAKFSDTFTKPRIFKLQLFVDRNCKITINGHSEITLFPTHSFVVDYDDMIIDSLVFNTDGVNFHAVIGY